MFTSERTESKTETEDDVLVSEPQFCNICYEELKSEQGHGGTLGTCLDSCGHWFCNSCWREHLVNQFQSDSISFICPEYECNCSVDFPTLLHFLHINDIKKHMERKVSEDVNRSPNAKWCPVPKCGRAIQIDDAAWKNPNVVCNCGTDLCFACMKNAHWPASCKQAELFREKVIANKDYSTLPKDFFLDPLPEAVLVLGKSCPQCKRFIEKIDGCSNMRCPCGVNFCWTCRKITFPYEVHACVEENKKTLLLAEYTSSLSPEKTKYYTLALEHRKKRQSHQLYKACSGCFTLSKKLVLLAKGNTFANKMFSSLPKDDGSWSTRKTAYKFLMTMLRTQMELHHIIENLAVLLDCEPKLRGKGGNSFLDNLITCVNMMENLLDPKQVQNLSTLVPRLRQWHGFAQSSISRLCRFVAQNA